LMPRHPRTGKPAAANCHRRKAVRSTCWAKRSPVAARFRRRAITFLPIRSVSPKNYGANTVSKAVSRVVRAKAPNGWHFSVALKRCSPMAGSAPGMVGFGWFDRTSVRAARLPHTRTSYKMDVHVRAEKAAHGAHVNRSAHVRFVRMCGPANRGLK
jgi:hypothetical protein